MQNEKQNLFLQACSIYLYSYIVSKIFFFCFTSFFKQCIFYPLCYMGYIHTDTYYLTRDKKNYIYILGYVQEKNYLLRVPCPMCLYVVWHVHRLHCILYIQHDTEKKPCSTHILYKFTTNKEKQLFIVDALDTTTSTNMDTRAMQRVSFSLDVQQDILLDLESLIVYNCIKAYIPNAYL